jgi:hypothetical protein
VERKELSIPTTDRQKQLTAKREAADVHATYKYMGSGVLNGKKVRIYLTTESRKKTAKDTGVVSEQEVSTKYWFGESTDLYRLSIDRRPRRAIRYFTPI